MWLKIKEKFWICVLYYFIEKCVVEKKIKKNEFWEK